MSADFSPEQEDYKKIGAFKFFCIQNFPFIANDFDQMTYYELLCKLAEYMKKLIENNNALINNQEALLNAFNELQSYVNSYFDDLNIQEQVNNKLDEMAQDGTLAEIINQEVFTEINEKIDTNTENIDKNSRNSKYIAPLFIDTEYRQSNVYVENFLTRCVNAGFKESQMLIHIQNDGTIIEDMTKFSGYNTIADNLNIPITSIKFHGSYSAVNYDNVILDIIDYFPKVDTVFVYNEQLPNTIAHGLALPSIIKNRYSRIKKVGFTSQYNGIYQRTITQEDWTNLAQVYDILGVNIYPSISSYNDAKNVTFEKVLEAFNRPEYTIPWYKEIWITESGVLPYWQFLELPESYHTELLTDTTKSIEPQRLFFNGLKNCNLSKKAVKICPWYLESAMTEQTYVLFDILKEIITDR